MRLSRTMALASVSSFLMQATIITLADFSASFYLVTKVRRTGLQRMAARVAMVKNAANRDASADVSGQLRRLFGRSDTGQAWTLLRDGR